MTNNVQQVDLRCSTGVIILAAGRSSRMGRPKLLLPWLNTTVLGHLIDQWQQLGAAQIAVIGAPGEHLLSGELDRLGFAAEDRIINPAPGRGMFSSIQCAAQWTGWRAGLTHWAVVLGDQPQVRIETLQSLLAFLLTQSDKVCQPARHGHRRHPVLLPKAVFQALAHSTAPHLKSFLYSFKSATFESNDPGLDLDIDRPEDYRRAIGLESAK